MTVANSKAVAFGRPVIKIEDGGVIHVDPERIRRFDGQPRKRFDPAGLRKLHVSMRTVGQRCPIEVRPLEDDPEFHWELIDGERRLLASKLEPKLKFLRAVVSTEVDDQFLWSVVANFCREEHTPSEIAEACGKLQTKGYTLQQIADAMGKSVPSVGNYLRLLKLHPEILALLEPDTPKEQRLPVAAGLHLSKLEPSVQLLALTKLPKGSRGTEQVRRVVERFLQDDPNHRHPEVRVRDLNPSERLERFTNRLKQADALIGGATQLALPELLSNLSEIAKVDIRSVLQSLFDGVEFLDASVRGAKNPRAPKQKAK